MRKNKNYTAIETNKSGVKFNNARLAELNEEFLQRRREYGEAEESIKVRDELFEHNLTLFST